VRKKFPEFQTRKGLAILLHLLCCEGFAVRLYSFILRAAHLRHPDLITQVLVLFDFTGNVKCGFP
jgi:hypothetical protein